jgi:hypothetical protein
MVTTATTPTRRRAIHDGAHAAGALGAAGIEMSVRADQWVSGSGGGGAVRADDLVQFGVVCSGRDRADETRWRLHSSRVGIEIKRHPLAGYEQQPQTIQINHIAAAAKWRHRGIGSAFLAWIRQAYPGGTSSPRPIEPHSASTCVGMTDVGAEQPQRALVTADRRLLPTTHRAQIAKNSSAMAGSTTCTTSTVIWTATTCS